MTNKEEILSKFVSEISKLDNDSFLSFNGIDLTIDTTSNSAINKDLLDSIFSNTNSLPQNKYELKITTSKYDDVIFFYDENDFVNRYKAKEDSLNENAVIFINPSGPSEIEIVAHRHTNKFIYNFSEYKGLLSLLTDTKELSQFKNESSKTFTLVSKEFGIFNVGYTMPKLEYFYRLSLEGKLERLKAEFQKKEFIQFFKEIVITSVHNKDEKFRFNEIISNLDSILSLTSRDYEAYVSNFAFDKIKSEFKEERELYFDSIDKSISSIGKQVVSFPLTFAASVFAVYKVENKPAILFLILLAYFLYTVIAFLILRMTSYNVQCLNEDVLDEEKEIKASYKKLYRNFQKDFKKIKKKITKLKLIIGSLFAVLIGLFILFIVFAADNIGWIDLSKCTFLQ